MQFTKSKLFIYPLIIYQYSLIDFTFLFSCYSLYSEPQGLLEGMTFKINRPVLILYVHSLMSFKGLMCSNKSLLQIEDLGRSNIILNIFTIISKDTESKMLCSFYQKKPRQTLDLTKKKLSVNTMKSPYKQAHYLSKLISKKLNTILDKGLGQTCLFYF